jgi:phosphate-selective porin
MSQVVIYPDLSTKDGVTLEEAYVKLTEPWTGKGVNLVFGQQNWFFGREIERSSSVREVPERARVFRNVFDGERDKGARLEFPDLAAPGLNLKAGVFNGNGIKSPHTFDNDAYKHFMGRLAYSLGWLDLGVSGESGKRFAKVNGGNGYAVKKHVGADAFVYYECPVLGGGSFGGEWMEGEGVQSPVSLHAKNMGWFLSEVQNLGGAFQIALRYDLWEPNRDAATTGDRVRATTLAAHYFWDDNTRITLASERPVTEDPNEARDDTATLQMQLKF